MLELIPPAAVVFNDQFNDPILVFVLYAKKIINLNYSLPVLAESVFFILPHLLGSILGHQDRLLHMYLHRLRHLHHPTNIVHNHYY